MRACLARLLPASTLLLCAACAGFWILPNKSAISIAAPALSSPVSDDDPLPALPPDPVSQAVFDAINRDRARSAAPPVAWDPKAAAAARQYTRKQIDEEIFGHYLLDGIPPYARLSWTGVFGLSAENAGAFYSTGGPLNLSNREIAMMDYQAMISEQPPNDGHRRAILNPRATHVGIGWSRRGNQFRIDEEFTCRDYRQLTIHRSGGRQDAIHVSGQARKGLYLSYVTFAVEPVPTPISRAKADSIRSYADPAPTGVLIGAGSFSTLEGLANFRSINLYPKGRFSFSFLFDRPGLWTFFLRFGKGETLEPGPGGQFSILIRPLARTPRSP